MESALLVALVGAWCFLVAVVGGMLGLVLGNIRLPVVMLLATSPAAGAGANIAISGVTAVTAAVGHVRAGRIDWRVVRVMAMPSMLGAVLGAIVSARLPGDVLLELIGLLLLWFGIDLLRPRRGSGAPRGDRSLEVRLATAGFGIGLLGGVVGLILGALRMPMLVRCFPDTVHRMVGSNLVVGALVGASGALAHVPTAFDLALFAVGAVASVPGALLGSRLTGRLSTPALVRGIGVALLCGGSATLARALLAG